MIFYNNIRFINILFFQYLVRPCNTMGILHALSTPLLYAYSNVGFSYQKHKRDQKISHHPTKSTMRKYLNNGLARIHEIASFQMNIKIT